MRRRRVPGGGAGHEGRRLARPSQVAHWSPRGEGGRRRQRDQSRAAIGSAKQRRHRHRRCRQGCARAQSPRQCCASRHRRRHHQPRGEEQRQGHAAHLQPAAALPGTQTERARASSGACLSAHRAPRCHPVLTSFCRQHATAVHGTGLGLRPRAASIPSPHFAVAPSARCFHGMMRRGHCDHQCSRLHREVAQKCGSPRSQDQVSAVFVAPLSGRVSFDSASWHPSSYVRDAKVLEQGCLWERLVQTGEMRLVGGSR